MVKTWVKMVFQLIVKKRNKLNNVVKVQKYKDIKSKLERYTGRTWHHSFLVKLVKRYEDNWIVKKQNNIKRRLLNQLKVSKDQML